MITSALYMSLHDLSRAHISSGFYVCIRRTSPFKIEIESSLVSFEGISKSQRRH